jgi:hypothetical protein
MKANLKSTTIIIVIGIIGVCIFLGFGDEIKKYTNEKIFESTYQFFLVTIMGGGVSLVFESYRRDREAKEREVERQREEKERRREIQRSLRANLIVAFNNVKKVRRLLRAEAILGEPHENNVVVGKEYNRQMNALMDAQLSIEFAYRVIKYETDLFQDSTLATKLKEANTYLRDIIDEYEKSYRKFSTESSAINLHEFPKLCDFIRPYAESREIKKDFWEPFNNAFDIIGRVLQS